MNDYENPLMKVNARAGLRLCRDRGSRWVGIRNAMARRRAHRLHRGDAAGLGGIAADGEPAIVGRPAPRT